MKLPSLLEEALWAVDDRMARYGDPAVTHSATAELASDALNHLFTSQDVCLFNIVQKIARHRHCPYRDNLVDIIGYILNLEMVEDPSSVDRYREMASLLKNWRNRG